MFQGHVNKIDFEYMEYAGQRFQQYWLRRPELLNSSSPTTNIIADGNTTFYFFRLVLSFVVCVYVHIIRDGNLNNQIQKPRLTEPNTAKKIEPMV